MVESSASESFLGLLGEDIAFSLIDPISRGIVSVVPDSVFEKIADFEIRYPKFALGREALMPLVRMAAMKLAKIKLGGMVSPAVEEDLNQKLNDVVNGVVRKVDQLVKERTTGIGTPGTHGALIGKSGDMLVIKIGSTRVVHGSKDCYVLKAAYDDNLVVNKVVVEEDDGSQQNQQNKKKGNQKKKTEKAVTLVPDVDYLKAEQAAQAIQDGDYRVCQNPACGARERIAAVAKKDASSPSGLPLRPWFAEAVTRITQSLNDAHRDLFADEVGLAMRELNFWKKMEQYQEFHKQITLMDLITLFQLPAKPVLPAKEIEPDAPALPPKQTKALLAQYNLNLAAHTAKVAAMRAERARMETEFNTVTIPQWDADCVTVRTQRETLFTEAADGLKVRLAKARQEKMEVEDLAAHEERVRKADAKHHEAEKKLAVQKKLMEEHGYTMREAKGDRSETPNTFWRTWPLIEIWKKYIRPRVRRDNLRKAARVAAAARAPHP